jgi:hypothetical protein
MDLADALPAAFQLLMPADGQPLRFLMHHMSPRSPGFLIMVVIMLSMVMMSPRIEAAMTAIGMSKQLAGSVL